MAVNIYLLSSIQFNILLDMYSRLTSLPETRPGTITHHYLSLSHTLCHDFDIDAALVIQTYYSQQVNQRGRGLNLD